MSAHPYSIPRSDYWGVMDLFVRTPSPPGSRNADNSPATRALIRRTLISLAVARIFFPLGEVAYADPNACMLQTANSVICSGNQSAGIATGSTPLASGGTLQSPPITTITVNSLSGGIAPATSIAGIRFQNDAGSHLTLNAGDARTPISLTATGDQTGAIITHSYGTPTVTVDFFGWYLPIGTGGNGGNVTIDSHAAITTDGDASPGISARSRAGGYSQPVVDNLKSFLNGDQGQTFTLSTVQNDSANIGKSVSGNNGGTFTLTNGTGGTYPTYTYNLTGMALSTLAAGQHIDTSIRYTVNSWAGLAPSEAVLTLRVSRLANGSLTVLPSTYFMEYGRAYEAANPITYVEGSTITGQISLQPDFDGYMTRLLSDSAVGGIGGNVLVNAYGSIKTQRLLSLGQSSYGILAQSKGGTGLAGSGGVFSGDRGNDGSAGGTVSVNNWATIHTYGEGSYGIVASSSGGDGGRGGGASFAGSGAAGGAGAKGGMVTVTNHGEITTERSGAFGILAQSVGGVGGIGGDGGWLGGGGGSGGTGTVNDPVLVTNHGKITTHGDDSHGIVVQNIGGFGGGGGGAGGIVALGSNGGNAGAGGFATINNFAAITTTGASANALMVQSIGGGGGSAGSAGGLVALGGDGTAGGNGGTATLTNTGELTATGLGARGILAQSIGGGGGNGGDSGGLFAIGGNGATSSAGGAVIVTNSGKITSHSNAILAESIGGGGGTGGSSGGWFAVGGNGGGGGDGGTVSATNSGDLTTTGRNAAALFAQSVGGGGGSGGNVVAAGAFGSVAIGGSGGSGGDGKGVVVRNPSGTIETWGVQSHGIYAQSLGGRGGNGGFAVALAAGKGLAVSLAVGGGAGGGGDGASVQVESQGKISTHEEMGHGIYAQSIGGGGGTGGFAVAASAAVEGVAASFAVGGNGGDGGDGSTVDVGKEAAVGGKIETHGANASGILAQSVGGGGGYGGLSVAGNITVGNSGGLSFSLGGSGGGGGDGKAVKVNSAATIITEGERAYGLRAQSLGGGGGDGGMAVSGSIGGGGGADGSPGTASIKLNVAVGGSAGDGGSGDTVGVNITGGGITTSGKDAHGIFAQSIGGGGGNGGMAISGSLGLGANNANIGISVGGSGGDGGIGNTVTVNNSGTVTTHGEGAFGIFAQSIGGGGGTGGASFTGNAILNKGKLGPNINIGFAFGGRGGKGGNAGQVVVSNRGQIETFGTSAHGIFAESVGGGGGQGGSARTMAINLSTGLNRLSTLMQVAFNLALGGKGGVAGDGNAVNISNWGAIVTHNTDSHGIYAQSVGGGGGTGGEGAHGIPGYATFLSVLDSTKMFENLSLAIGGVGGAAGDGKTVTVDQHGSITTNQVGSFGIFAQSVGGGGGTGGVGATGLMGKVGIGGSGGASGDGGTVNVIANGNINTHGVGAYGVFAQSIGGGGGIAGNIDRGISQWVSWLGFDHGVGIGLGIVRNSENGGNGGEVSVTGGGTIHTRGAGSIGIFAQSAGGGGGVAGDQSGWGVTGSAGGNGSGDKITVDWTGSIITEGEKAHGIFAQSAGGEKTIVHIYDVDADGNLKPTPTNRTLLLRQNLAKDVDITVRGNVLVNGAGADAIFAQSEGSEGNGNIAVKILNKGIVQGGSGEDSVAVHLVGGANNSVENSGTIRTLNGIHGLAIVGGSGNDSITNSGTLTGLVHLGAGNNALMNQAGGLFNSGSIVDLGAGNTLTNSGILSPGGISTATTTTLTGNLVQNGNGVLGIDLSLAGRRSDRLNVAGTAQLGGLVRLNPIDTGWARVGTRQSVVLSASDGTRINGLTVNAPRSPLVSYALAYPNANDVAISTQISFTPRNLSRNGQLIGAHLNAIQAAGGSASMDPYIAALFAQADDGSLSTAYEKLGPGVHGALTTASTTSSLEFNDAMHSCRQREGDYRFIREGECSWARFGGGIRDQERSAENPGYRQDIVTMAGGFQKAIRDNLHLGFGVSYQQSALNSLYSDVNGERFEGGVILKQRFDATRLSLSFSVGYGHYSTRRLVDFATPGVHAQARPTLWSSAVHGRISHDIMASDTAYIRPMLGLGVSYVSRDAYDETGAGGADLRVAKQSDTFVSLHPAIELGGESRFGADGTLLRHYVRIGMTQFLGSNERNVTASLEGAPSGIQPFTVATRNDKTYADLAIGVDILRKSGTSVRLEYSGQFSNNSSANAIGVKLAMPF